MLARARFRIRRNGRFGARRRRGVATVELALLLPVLMFVVFGTLELCCRASLRQTAAVTAYEGARLAARRTISAARVTDRCESLLEGRRITGAVVTVIPADTTELSTGDLVQVRIEIPWQENTPSTMALPNAGSVVVTASMLRE